MREVLPAVELHAPAAVRDAIAAVGRSEDLRFSPSNRLLAIASYEHERCLVLRIRVESTPDGPRVCADDFIEIASDGIGHLHGVDFIDDQTIVCGNRNGRVSIISLPEGAPGGRHCTVAATRHIRGTPICRVKSPGSVAARYDADGMVSILVCNNYVGTVTRHVVDPRDGYRIVSNRVFLRRSLDIPDGVALSGDGGWIAVSSHGSHDVKMFSTAGKLRQWTAPAGTLGEANYPHAVRFCGDDRFVLVADAGAPLIHVYDRGEGWSGTRGPIRSAVVLSDEVYVRGRVNPSEGGPKGMDIDKTNQVVAVTCEEQSLSFFALNAVTGVGAPA